MASRTVRPLSDEFIRLLVLSQPIPERLIVDLANALEAEHVRAYAGRRGAMTPALWETLKLVAAGLTTRQIAERRGVSFVAAQDQVKRVLAVFDARDRMEVVTRCYREGIM